MPCNSEYMEPSYPEVASKEACELICYLFPKIEKYIPRWVRLAANSYYGNESKLHSAEVMLLDTISCLTNRQMDKYVFDGKNPQARKLADWIDGPGKRIKAERQKKKKENQDIKEAKKILSRLRQEEVDILENYYKHFE